MNLNWINILKNLRKKLFLILLYGQFKSVSSLDSLSIDASNKSNLKKIGLNSINAS